jgi:hypothetical protein
MNMSACALCIVALTVGCSRTAPPPQTSTSSPAQPAPSYFQVDPATAGSISGTVTWKGSRPAMAVLDMSEDPTCQKLNPGKVYDNSLLVDKRGDVANAFVYIKSGLDGKQFAPPSKPAVIDQRGCRFQPLVLGVQTQQQVDIINSDPVTHNIHAMAHVNREWNHSQEPGDAVMHRRFLVPEMMVPVKCNIHSWMREYIGVVDNPYFAVTTRDGHFDIPNLPPGTYTLAIWQEKAAPEEQQIVVPAKGAEKIAFQLHSK